MTRSVKDTKTSWTFMRSSSRLLNTDQAKKFSDIPTLFLWDLRTDKPEAEIVK
jgi:hypothetical protein